MKRLFKEHSPYLLILTLAEIILSIISIEAFVYSDSLTYSDSLIYNAIGIETLLETMYSSTFWALILFTIAFITICSITTIVYQKLDYLFMGILGWCILLILGINVGNPLKDILTVLLLFIPIIAINIIAYKTEKKKLEKKRLKK
ncbi:MAG: hypothetical protein J1F35_04130 [Erysipelotrichales bacterium]|nr:hypothetical protein [Erysipelotrichales bacterium]